VVGDRFFSHPPLLPEEERESLSALPNTPTLFDYPVSSEKSSLSENPTSESSYSEFAFLEDEGGVSSIDLIQVDNSSKNPEESDEGGGSPFEWSEEDWEALFNSFNVFFSDREFLKSYILKRYEKVGNVRKIIKSYLRLKRLSSCGKSGHISAVFEQNKLKKVKLVPHRCNSVHCSYCNFYDSRKRMRQISAFYESLLAEGRELSFITLTIPNTFDIFEAVERAKKSLQRLYQFRLLGKRNWVKVVRLFRRETLKYYRALRMQGYSPSEALKRVKFQIKLFREFEKAVSGYSYETKFAEILKAVWKFELTYSKKTGFHAHWHAITTLFIPKLLLTVIARLVGFGEICDIRRVRGAKAVKELSKYVAKSFELKHLSFEEKLDVEVAMHSFQKLRVWNISKEELLRFDEHEDVDVVPLPSVAYVLRSSFSLGEAFEIYKELEGKEKQGFRLRVFASNRSSIVESLEAQGIYCRERSCEFDVMFDDAELICCSISSELEELVRQSFSDFLTFLSFRGYEGEGVKRLREIYERVYLESADDLECVFDDF